MVEIAIVLFIFVVLALIDKFTFWLKNLTFLCKFPGWHISKIEGNDGCSNKGTCMRCGKSLLMDSNGDWF